MKETKVLINFCDKKLINHIRKNKQNEFEGNKGRKLVISDTDFMLKRINKIYGQNEHIFLHQFINEQKLGKI